MLMMIASVYVILQREAAELQATFGLPGDKAMHAL